MKLRSGWFRILLAQLAISSPLWANPFSEVHESISERLVDLATQTDSFFINVKDVDEYNKTSLRLFQTFQKIESESMENKFNFRFNLHLPNLEERFKISFERQSQVDEVNLSGSGERLETQTDDRSEYTRGGLEYLIPRLFNFDMNLSAGVRIDIPPTPYASFRLSRELDVGPWLARFYASTFWSHRDGVGQSVSQDFDYDLSESLLLRLVNEATWLNSTDTIRVAHGPTLYQKLSKRRMLAYSARARYLNRPNYRLEGHHFSLSYRQALSENMFYYEFIPAMQFVRAENFKGQGILALKLELVF